MTTIKVEVSVYNGYNNRRSKYEKFIPLSSITQMEINCKDTRVSYDDGYDGCDIYTYLVRIINNEDVDKVKNHLLQLQRGTQSESKV